jgi:hypothetical protein
MMRHAWVLRGAVTVVITVSVAACATRAPQAVDRATVFLSEGPAPRGDCIPVDAPGTLPSPDALVDTSSLGAQVRAFQEQLDDGFSGYVLLTMLYEPDGTNVRRDVIEHSLPSTAADSIQKLVFASLREMPEHDESVQVRLRVDVNDGVRFRTGRSEYCPPSPRDPQLEASLYGVQGTGIRYRRGGRERIAIVRLGVHPNGYVTGGRFLRGAPTGSTLEQDVVRYLRQYSFDPARVDGVPVPGTIDVPVRIPA